MHERQKEQARAYHVVHLLVLVASSTQKYAQSDSNRVTKVDSFRRCECVNDEMHDVYVWPCVQVHCHEGDRICLRWIED